MPSKTQAGKHTCKVCGRSFTSQGRLEHHRAAEHAPKTSEDIPRMRSMPRTRVIRSGVLHKRPPAMIGSGAETD